MAKKAVRRRTADPKSELVLVGGRKPKLRKASRREWTRAKEEAYVNALAETCNLTIAAAEAGMSASSARERRKTNARFRAGCAEAIAFAYHRLELATLERSLNGTEKITIRKDGSEERVREFPLATALTLLRMHRETAAEATNAPDEEEIEEVRERVFNRLQRLREKLGKSEANSQ